MDALGTSDGAGGRNRTDMTLRSLDFESSASTSFTTPAHVGMYTVTFPNKSRGKGGCPPYCAVSKKYRADYKSTRPPDQEARTSEMQIRKVPI